MVLRVMAAMVMVVMAMVAMVMVVMVMVDTLRMDIMRILQRRRNNVIYHIEEGCANVTHPSL